VGAEQELLVVVEQVEAAFEVGEEHSYGLDPLLVGQVLQPLLANLMGGHAIVSVGLGFQVEFFQLLIRES
jgi:murein endopeptidase